MKICMYVYVLISYKINLQIKSDTQIQTLNENKENMAIELCFFGSFIKYKLCFTTFTIYKKSDFCHSIQKGEIDGDNQAYHSMCDY